jgi:hypothetical protein
MPGIDRERLRAEQETVVSANFALVILSRVTSGRGLIAHPSAHPRSHSWYSRRSVDRR